MHSFDDYEQPTLYPKEILIEWEKEKKYNAFCKSNKHNLNTLDSAWHVVGA